jgi:hypothetical protein
MNRTIMTGKYRRIKGKAMQWYGSVTRDRFYAITGRRLERDGELLEAFGRFHEQRRSIEQPHIYFPR